MASTQSNAGSASEIWQFLKWPICIALLAASVVGLGLGFKTISVIMAEGADGSVLAGGLLMFFSGLASVFSVFIIVFALVDNADRYGPSLWKFPAVTAVGQWLLIGLFYVIAGTTYPLPQEMSPLVTSSGTVYMAGEEIPRRFLEPSGAKLENTRQFQHSFNWTDPDNPGIEFTTSVTTEATLRDNRRMLTELIGSISGETVPLQVINYEMWELYDPEIERINTELEAIARQGSLSERTVIESEVPWVERVRVVSTETTASFNN